MSNGQKTAFTISMIQYPFVSFLKVILVNMIRLHHFFYLFKIPFVLKIKL